MSEYEEDFNKIYFFKTCSEWVLPDKVFESPKWSIPKFQKKKQELNRVKGLLGKYKLKVWSKHTANRDRAGFVMKKLTEKIKPELLTQAWCKFYEILAHFPVIPLCAVSQKKLDSLHLCEAPGAFVCALNHYLILNYPGLKWSWCANTLNPNYEGNQLSEMISDDRFIRYTLPKWNFGSDFSGDITKFYNHKYLVDMNKNSKISLITADGSVDCMIDPGEQERLVERLHFCETLTALSLLQIGGTFVLKIFTMFEESTINLLYLLNCIFETVAVFKPCTSKSGNSEVYVVNIKYKGSDLMSKFWPTLITSYKDINIFNTKAIFNLPELPQTFLSEVDKCSDFFMRQQVNTILDNIHHFEHKSYDNIYMVKSFIAQIYIIKYELTPIPDDMRILPNVCVTECWRIHSSKKSKNIYNAKVENILQKTLDLDILEIVIGKEIFTVHNSKFTHNDNLKKIKHLFGNHAKSPELYTNVVNVLDKTNIVINITQFYFLSFSKFQRQFFEKLCVVLNGEKNIILVNIPFVTHFLVGLLYILFFAFEKVYIGNGLVYLFQPKIFSVESVLKIFSKIQSTYNLVDLSEAEFSKDIVQLVSPKVFESGSFIEKIWNYNNMLFYEDKCYLTPFTSLHID